MTITELRRENLRRWFSIRAIPNKEKSYLSQLMKVGGTASFGEKAARRLEKDYGMEPGYLDADPDLSLSSNSAEEERAAYLPKALQQPGDEAENIEIRQFDTGGSMGRGVLLRDQPGVIESWRVSPEWLQKNVRHHSGANNMCLVTGFGDSMRPLYEPGDPVLVDTGVKAVDFDGVYFFRVGDEGFIKRLQRIPGQGIVAISENKSYRDWTITNDMDFEVFGRVLKAWKSEDY